MRRLLQKPATLPLAFAIAAAVFLVLGIWRRDWVSLAAAVLFIVFTVRYLVDVTVQSHPASGIDEHLERGGAVVFWRPGCPFCGALNRALGSELRDRPYWVNIWDDPDGAARLRSYHNGDEIVPTLLTSTGAIVATNTDLAVETIRTATPAKDA